MQNIVSELSDDGDSIDPKIAKRFVKSLIEEFNIPLTKKESKEIFTICESGNKFSLRDFKHLILKTLPEGKIFNINNKTLISSHFNKYKKNDFQILF